ncbi:hypothetical protein PQX77_019181 [Marasmius sp. AFHP31]|nr:hypothetical protein PQX77_019181 [Marasmius sp. AFHP31]
MDPSAPYVPIVQLFINQIPYIFTRRLVSIAVQFLLYGVYAVLFGICISLLFKRRREHRVLHVTATLVVFILATVSLVLHTTSLALEGIQFLGVAFTGIAPPGPLINEMRERYVETNSGYIRAAAFLIFYPANMAADTFFIWRCCIVWGRSTKVIYLPIALSAANHVMAFINMGINAREGFNNFLLALRPLTGTDGLNDTLIRYIQRGSSPEQSHRSNIVNKALVIHIVFSMVNAFVNLLVTFLLAGRIYYIHREARALLGKGVNTFYRTLIAIIIESGILYPIILIIYVFSPAQMILYPALIQVVGIAQTMIIVRTGLGLDSTPSTIGTITPDATLPGIPQTQIHFGENSAVRSSNELDVELENNQRIIQADVEKNAGSA